jgi:diguanylate cyclase (GGDEF)-like protein/PAS domain S-box-containing protein
VPTTNADLARAVFAATRDSIVVTDLDGSVTGWNPGAERLYGYSGTEMLGRSVFEFLVEPLPEGMDLLADGHHVPPFDAAVRAADGRIVRVQCAAFGVYDDDGRLTGIGTVAHDVSEVRQLQDEALRHRFYDDVTGMPNRRLLEQRLREALADGTATAVICVDLDGFRLVNDTWGHVTGDDVLDEVGRRLTALVPASDTVGRLGADQFVVVRREATPEDLHRLAAAIAVALDPPVYVAGRPPIMVSASVGIAVARGAACTDDLLRDADSAVHRAKQQGRGNVVWFSDDLRADAARRLVLQSDLRTALDAGQLAVVYQPILDLGGTGAVVAVEALCRWTHPVLGPISPLQFIAVAEEADLIGRLGAQVLEQACRDLASEREDLGVAVNLSTMQLRDASLVDLVIGVTELYGIDPGRLTFEVVEAAIADGEAAVGTLHALRALGCRISVDDFGTGWSSLARLRQLPIDEVKVDRAFIAALPGEPADQAIVEAVVRLARSMDLDVVAEGVETEEQLAAVRAAGCDMAQGYLLGMPGML